MKKMSRNAKKLKGGTLWDFSTSVLSENQKIEGRILRGKKSHRAENTLWSR